MTDQTIKRLTRSQFAHSLGISLRTFDLWRQRKLVPEPERTPTGRPRWPESAVFAVLSQKPKAAPGSSMEPLPGRQSV